MAKSNPSGLTRLSSYVTFQTKHSYIYYVTLLTVLSGIFYLVGLWRHFTGATSSSSSLSYSASSTHFRSCATTTTEPTLDLHFSAHHQAPDPPPTSARASHIPPCKDPQRSLKYNLDRLTYRERHCPEKCDRLKCRVPVPVPYDYKWPESRGFAWYANVPHKELTVDRCEMEDILLEMDRVLRPEGGVIIRDDADTLVKIKSITDSMEWEGRIAGHEKGARQREKILFASKKDWTGPAPDHNSSNGRSLETVALPILSFSINFLYLNSFI